MEEEVQALLADIEGNGYSNHLDDYLYHRPPGSSRQTATANVRSQYAFGDVPTYLGRSVYGQVAQAQPLYRSESYTCYEPPADTFGGLPSDEPDVEEKSLATNGRSRLSLRPGSTGVRPVNMFHSSESRSGPFRLSDVENSLAPSQQLRPTQGIRGRSTAPYVPDTTIARTRPILNSHPDFSSSSSVEVPSSPSYQVSQRRTFQDTRRYSGAFAKGRPVLFSPVAEPQPAIIQSGGILFNDAPPVVQGIRLVSLNELPDRIRSVFPFPLLNAVQSKCFPTIFKSNDNLVVSAPTGSGKTAILEMAICRLLIGFKSDQYKIIYMAPTKSLCSERRRDWTLKFNLLNLQCAELTGDTDQSQIRSVQNANIIITTPEKWDSMTRKWKDHARLMHLIKLFLIDEVHILKDTRGATLEAVVSRMKSVGSNVRFVALSATIPNSDDIATWLGKDHIKQHLPAQQERFGEEFRPVKLQKFVYGLNSRGNDFAFDSVCDAKLPDIIAKHSRNKPIMVFCCTRKSTTITAKLLADIWTSKGPRDRCWAAPRKVPAVSDTELRKTMASGVAFHHAGLDNCDRSTVEKGYLDGQISVICCTSTLAVGVNLPCHLVIIKNTVSWQDEGLKEYADLEMMQMLGRAGRPQFDDSAIAIIITRQEKVKKYEKLVSGEELLESCLHLNLIDHLNAEIGLGTVRDLHTAKRWLASTFLYVRLSQNPNHYKLDGDTLSWNLDDRIKQICDRDIRLLEETNLVCGDEQLKCTEYGDAMARYYIRYETMKSLLSLPPRAKMSEILSALCEAAEFHEVRFRSGEKSLYKAVNSANGIKFPIKVDIALAAQKRSIIIQAELGGVDYPADEQFVKHKKQYQQDRAILFSHIHRLIRCLIDCQLHLQDGSAARHALELARSFGARVWDNSPLQMKQIPTVGLAAVRKLAIAGINSLETLEAAEPHRLNLLLQKNPGHGEKILGHLSRFPKLRVTVKMMGKDTKQGKPVKLNLKAELGFLNDKVPSEFGNRPVYVCLLAERSDGHLIDFRRFSAKKIGNGQDVLLSADLVNASQYITCYVMCDDFAGTMRYAELKPNLSNSLFPSASIHTQGPMSGVVDRRPRMNVSRRRTKSGISANEDLKRISSVDEFLDDDIDDRDMVEAVDGLDFSHIESFEPFPGEEGIHAIDADSEQWEPTQLGNGKWACNHKCKDKATCKHMCCREGVDKRPKPPKAAVSIKVTVKRNHAEPKWKTTKSSATITSKRTAKKPAKGIQPYKIDVIDLSSAEPRDDYTKFGPHSNKSLEKLHKSTTNARPACVIASKKSTPFAMGHQTQISFLRKAAGSADNAGKTSSNSGEDMIDELLSPSAFIQDRRLSTSPGPVTSPRFDEDVSELEAVMADFGDPMTSNNSYRDPPGECCPSHSRGASATYQREESYDRELDSPTSHLDGFPRLSSLPTEDAETSQTLAKDDHLFIHTSSPEKLPQGIPRMLESNEIKRYSMDHSQIDPSNDAPPMKKRRLAPEADSGGAPRLPGVTDYQKPRVAHNAKPDWVDGIDPELLAEFGDIVEFY